MRCSEAPAFRRGERHASLLIWGDKVYEGAQSGHFVTSYNYSSPAWPWSRTWNPIAGCKYGCEWAHGKRVITCAAELAAMRSARAYPGHYANGFRAHYWDRHTIRWPGTLVTPAIIGVCTTGDLFGKWVPARHLNHVLETMRKAPRHTFIVSTKNPIRMYRWRDKLSPNVWCGVSIVPDVFDGYTLTTNTRSRAFQIAVGTLSKLPVPVRWVDVQPFTWDCAEETRFRGITWCMVGPAVVNFRYKFQPKQRWVEKLMASMDEQKATVWMMPSLSWEGERRVQLPG